MTSLPGPGAAPAPPMAALRAPDPVLPRSALSVSLEPIISAASRGQYELLLAETERAFARIMPGAASRALLRSGGAWREWSALDGGEQGCAVALPAESLAWDQVREIGASVFVPISVGAVCVLLQGRVGSVATSDALDVLRQCVALALQNCERQRIASQSLDEVQSLQRVAMRMLQKRPECVSWKPITKSSVVP